MGNVGSHLDFAVSDFGREPGENYIVVEIDYVPIQINSIEFCLNIIHCSFI